MKLLKASLAVLLAGVGLVGQVQADTLSWLSTQTGTTRTILYKTDAASSSLLGATLWAEVDFTLTSMVSGTSIFDVTVKNKSFGAGTNTLMSIGIDVVAPTLTSATDSSNLWGVELNQVLPTFQTVDLCVFRDSTAVPGNNGCSGGAIAAGLDEQMTAATFSLTLNTAGNFLTSGIQFNSPYGSKFQNAGTAGNSYELGGCDMASNGCGGGSPPIEIPEPGSLALVGLAMMGLAVTARRRA